VRLAMVGVGLYWLKLRIAWGAYRDSATSTIMKLVRFRRGYSNKWPMDIYVHSSLVVWTSNRQSCM